VIAALVAGVILAVVPVHGLVLEEFADGTAIVRTDAVPGTFPGRTRRYRFVPSTHFRAGTSIDALLVSRANPEVLRDPIAAAAFAPGLPDAGRVVPVEIGGALPAAELVDQNERVVALERDFRGKTLLLSFVFTRCPDRTLCPAISGKFAYLQERLDPARFALVTITLDPQYDSPAILRAYGTGYGVRAESWKLLTGTGSTILRLLDAFRISSMRTSASSFLHDDRLFIVTPAGRVADIVETADWDPPAVVAQARSVSGLASNPLERLKLALVADAIALCGGSRFAGIALLELTLFTLLTLIALIGMWGVARILWAKHDASG